jgi:hypothetical protein
LTLLHSELAGDFLSAPQLIQAEITASRGGDLAGEDCPA